MKIFPKKTMATVLASAAFLLGGSKAAEAQSPELPEGTETTVQLALTSSTALTTTSSAAKPYVRAPLSAWMAFGTDNQPGITNQELGFTETQGSRVGVDNPRGFRRPDVPTLATGDLTFAGGVTGFVPGLTLFGQDTRVVGSIALGANAPTLSFAAETRTPFAAANSGVLDSLTDRVAIYGDISESNPGGGMVVDTATAAVAGGGLGGTLHVSSSLASVRGGLTHTSTSVDNEVSALVRARYDGQVQGCVEDTVSIARVLDVNAGYCASIVNGQEEVPQVQQPGMTGGQPGMVTQPQQDNGAQDENTRFVDGAFADVRANFGRVAIGARFNFDPTLSQPVRGVTGAISVSEPFTLFGASCSAGVSGGAVAARPEDSLGVAVGATLICNPAMR